MDIRILGGCGSGIGEEPFFQPHLNEPGNVSASLRQNMELMLFAKASPAMLGNWWSGVVPNIEDKWKGEENKQKNLNDNVTYEEE